MKIKNKTFSEVKKNISIQTTNVIATYDKLNKVSHVFFATPKKY